MKTITKRGSNGRVPLPPLPKQRGRWNAAKIERWLRSIGAKPIDAATKKRLIASGHWGMPDE
jgi:hypothetical protein